MSRHSRIAVLAGFGLAMSVAAADSVRADPPVVGPRAEAPTEDVTVTAARRGGVDISPTPEIRDFIASHGETAPLGQLARWADAVCPAVVGLPPKFNAFVAERVTQVAKDIGARTGRPGCSPNVEVIFTTEPQKLLDLIREKHTVLLGYHYAAQVARLSRFTQPIQAWYVTGTESPNGVVVQDDSAAGTVGGTPGSKFGAQLSSRILAVLVVADAAKVAEKPIGAVADATAFLALAQSRLSDGCGRLSSVTEFMAPACEPAARPEALTDGDLAYLRALYAASPRGVLAVQKQGIGERMRQAVGPR